MTYSSACRKRITSNSLLSGLAQRGRTPGAEFLVVRLFTAEFVLKCFASERIGPLKSAEGGEGFAETSSLAAPVSTKELDLKCFVDSGAGSLMSGICGTKFAGIRPLVVLGSTVEFVLECFAGGGVGLL